MKKLYPRQNWHHPQSVAVLFSNSKYWKRRMNTKKHISSEFRISPLNPNIEGKVKLSHNYCYN